MLRIDSNKIPSGIIFQLSYILFYSVLWYVFGLFLFSLLISQQQVPAMSDYAFFMGNLLFASTLGTLTSYLVTPIEKKIIKRNIFVAGLIQVLKKHRSITFREIYEDYAYFVFQNKKVTGRDKDWSTYIEALIALGVIDLKNHKALKLKGKNFDYIHFNKRLDDVELILKDKKVDIDKLIQRLDNYIL